VIINKTYFFGELDIANTNNIHVEARLNSFIEKYEPKFLALLFGETMYSQLTAQLLLTPINANWSSLRDKVKGLLAMYVWYYYSRDQASKTTAAGEVAPSVENGVRVSVMDKQVKVWNEMVEGIAVLYDYLDLNEAIYVDWVSYGRYRSYPHFSPINAMNL